MLALLQTTKLKTVTIPEYLKKTKVIRQKHKYFNPGGSI
ncbi:hypothetical protein COO91_05795 [Nostoc flagelliforme CCNUN1]|uniref:Uncharacterized protein n=1 Tax=Nostoc flagelliforme CCNUN1 TaxID=2038116 RepID=A0A2K8SWI9_9NOSO|nr:hypothetical protein COO91_05795 [Nostoc flagelliforme CCNUN1]